MRCLTPQKRALVDPRGKVLNALSVYSAIKPPSRRKLYLPPVGYVTSAIGRVWGRNEVSTGSCVPDSGMSKVL